jgi:hypothetical protein
MLNMKTVWMNLVLCAATLGATTAHAEAPHDLARAATATQAQHVDKEERTRLAGQLGVGVAGVTAAQDRGAELYLDAAAGFVTSSKWGGRLGLRLAPGAGSWADLNAAATYDSFLGRTALQVGVANFQPFYLCFDFSGSGDACHRPNYTGPMLGIQHEFRILGPFGVQTGARAAVFNGQAYAMFNFGIGVSL